VQLTTQYYLNHKVKLQIHASVISCGFFLVKCGHRLVLSSRHSTSEPYNELLMPTGYAHLSINVNSGSKHKWHKHKCSEKSSSM